MADSDGGHALKRGENFLIYVKPCALPLRVGHRTKVLGRDNDSTAAEPKVTNPRGVTLVQGVHKTFNAGEVRAAKEGPAVKPVR